MPEKHLGSRAIFWIAAVLCTAADQFTKWLIYERALGGAGEISVIPGFFSLRAATNPGIAWGLFASMPFLVTVAGFLAALIVVMYYYWFAGPFRAEGLAWGSILGGAAGNLIDRVAFGHARDFLDFQLAGWSWPTFNAADAFITLAAIYIVVHYLFIEDEHQTHQ